MDRHKVDISIIMATFNRGHLIVQALRSIENQSFKNWECIIIDDGSLDDTAEIVQRFSNSDSRFIYQKRKAVYKKGLPGCRNQGLDHACGDFIIFFDDDDLIHPDNLKVCFSLIKKRRHDFINYRKQPFYEDPPQFENISRIENINQKEFLSNDLDKVITGVIPIASCTVMWAKNCFENHRFNENLMYAEEWECYSRILSDGKNGILIDEILYFSRKHPNSNTGEFFKGKEKRHTSYLDAAYLIIDLLKKKSFFNTRLKRFFIRLGFELNSYGLINKTLQVSNSSLYEKVKYRLGYNFYPVIKPLLNLKSRI